MAKKDDEERVETTRVVQLWPVDLKARVQDIAGARGLTRFTLEAVEQRLDREQAERDEVVDEALGDDAPKGEPATEPTAAEPEPTPPPLREEREEDYDGGPAFLIGRAEEPRDPERAVQTAPEPETEPGAYAEPTEEESQLDPVGDEPGFLDRLRARAQSAGIDLQTAAELEREPAAVGAAGAAPAPPAPVVDPELTPATADGGNLDACPNCGDPLVDGECWSCGWPNS